MPIAYRFLFPAMWLSWAVYWFWASWRTRPTERREPIGSRLLHVIPLLLAVWLLLGRAVPSWLHQRLLPRAAWEFWTAAVIIALGLLFTVWARVHLGANWSGVVTIKQGHELIDTGPYAVVRHPIYSGLLAAFIGSAVAIGEWRGVLAVLIASAAFWRKLGLEERWMTERFGERYRVYRERVPALVPFAKLNVNPTPADRSG